MAVVAAVAMTLAAASGCTGPSEEPYRAPILADRDWHALVPLMGDFGPSGGDFEGDFAASRFQGFRYPAPAGARVRVELTRLTGTSDPVLAVYGPQLDTGIWGPPLAVDDNGGPGLNAALTLGPLARGAYLVVVTTRGVPGAGRYHIGLHCQAGCDAAATCPLHEACSATDVCLTGYLLDAGGCPTCDCLDECRVDADCGPEEACLGGRCEPYCTCRDPYAPVCGSDGVTYSNACEAGCQGARAVSDRPCAEVCPPLQCDLLCPYGRRLDPQGCETCQCRTRCEACDQKLQPVCTWSGRSFGNACLAECQGEQVAYGGACRADCAPAACDLSCPNGYAQDDRGCPVCACAPPACPTDVALVCGSDGVTYRNACQAQNAGASVLFDGPCPPRCHSAADCPDGYDCRSGLAGLPACRLDQPDCLAVCFQQPRACTPDTACLPGDACGSDGQCHSPCDCRPVYAPVCGDDGVSYGNACMARCAEQAVAHPGTCCDPSVLATCDLACPGGYAIGADGCERCACADPSTCACSADVVNPVCGADGVIYPNECFMRCAGVEAADDPATCG